MARRPIPNRRNEQSSTVDSMLAEAISLFARGENSGSEKLVSKVLKRHPRLRDARHLSAMLAFRKGSFETAAQQLAALSTDFPDYAPVLNDLGMVLSKLERFTEAEAALVRAVNLAPQIAGFHLNLAIVYQRTEMIDDAEQHARTAIRLKRDYADAYRVLSEILAEDGRVDLALEAARTAKSLAPNDVRSVVRLAEALNAADDVDAACAVYEQVLATAPDSMAVQTSYGRFLTERGLLGRATALIEELIARHPHAPGLYGMLVRATRVAPDSELPAKMEAFLLDPSLGDEQRAMLHFGLAKAYEDIKAFPAAFEHALAGNKLVRQSKHYSAEKTETAHEALRAAATPALISRLGQSGCKDETPIFIIGMPRSGTTLTEQILGTHSEVHGAGEIKDLATEIRAMRRRVGVHSNAELFEMATGDDWRSLGEAYVKRIRRKSPDTRFIVNKMPENFIYLGHIRLALPNAKVIYCRRAAPDNCISIFNLQFATSGMGYGYDLGELGEYYRKHVRLMQHWQTVMPDFILTNQYEDLVANPEEQSRKLLDFCNLDWEDGVLRFFENRRSVRTASVVQVRKPVYKGSVGRYKRYGDAVQPLLEALDWDEENQEIRA